MIKRNLLVMGLAVLLSACGFQLRGTATNELSIKELDVSARNAYGETVTQLRQALESSGVRVGSGATYKLNLVDEKETQRNLSYASAGRASDIELNTLVVYELQGRDHLPLMGDKVEVQKVVSHDGNNLVGSDSEIIQVRKEMRRGSRLSAPLGGMWLISFALALTAAVLCNLPRLLASKRNGFIGAGLVLLVAPWAIGLALKHHAWTSPSGAPLTVAAIQGNVEQSMKWDPAQIDAQLALYRDMSFSSKPVDLLVWPETAVPVLKESVEGYLGMMGKFAADRHSALITGVPIRQEVHHQKRYFNGITVVGEGDGTYLKQKLVPFGEYVPLQDMLRGLIAFFDLPMSDFARGPSDQAMLQAKGYQIAPFICYEVVYPEFAAGLSAQSDLLLTISNDTWFGRSIGPLQHLQMAQMRALEAGRWMIRATNNGVTGLINPFGQITAQIPQFERGILYGEVVPMHNLTPYLQWRSWPLIIVCLGLFGWALLAARMSKTV